MSGDAAKSYDFLNKMSYIYIYDTSKSCIIIATYNSFGTLPTNLALSMIFKCPP